VGEVVPDIEGREKEWREGIRRIEGSLLLYAAFMCLCFTLAASCCPVAHQNITVNASGYATRLNRYFSANRISQALTYFSIYQLFYCAGVKRKDLVNG
jgi:hypothetical protein